MFDSSPSADKDWNSMLLWSPVRAIRIGSFWSITSHFVTSSWRDRGSNLKGSRLDFTGVNIGGDWRFWSRWASRKERRWSARGKIPFGLRLQRHWWHTETDIPDLLKVVQENWILQSLAILNALAWPSKWLSCYVICENYWLIAKTKTNFHRVLSRTHALFFILNTSTTTSPLHQRDTLTIDVSSFLSHRQIHPH